MQKYKLIELQFCFLEVWASTYSEYLITEKNIRKQLKSPRLQKCHPSHCSILPAVNLYFFFFKAIHFTLVESLMCIGSR